MKISQLNTKSFLGGAGAAANSYVLINYEDNSTSEPITYKATIQELGKAIANDLQLYKKTQEGAVTTSVNNGAYVDGSAENFITLHTPKNVQINGAGDLGYFTTADSDTWTSLNTGVSEGYVTNAISGLASTGYVTNAVANAGGGGFDPAASVACAIQIDKTDASLTLETNLYPLMMLNDSTGMLYVKDPDEDSFEELGSPVMKSALGELSMIAYISTSGNRACIRDKDDAFIGFLSDT